MPGLSAYTTALARCASTLSFRATGCGIVNLHQATSAGARVAVTKHWATSGTRKIDVQTVAASGYPTKIDIDAFVAME